MRFQYTVDVEIQREEGKFMGKDEANDMLQEALSSADPGQLDGENGGVYSVVQWDVSDGMVG